MNKLQKYFHLWWKLTINSFISTFSTRFSASIFLLGKILRFTFFLIFLLSLFTRTKFLGSYTSTQMIFFFLTFNLVDTITQLFFREVYRFRPMVVSGDFDLVLVKPINPLFRALAGGADPLDLLMLIPYTFALVYTAGYLGSITTYTIFLYILLIINGLVIATGFHILVLALAVVTTQIDHAIMIYRDLTSMGRLPIDIYREPLRSVLTFVIPVGIMMTFPAKALMGALSVPFILVSCGIGGLFMFVCFRVWKYALTQYSSASS